MRLKLYNHLVNRVPAIRRKYHNIRYLNNTRYGRFLAWLALFFMNIAWLFGKRKFGIDSLNPDENKKLPIKQSESSLSVREKPEALAIRLMKYDIISFDVFDTLIFRPFAKPTDLFYFIGAGLNYPDFSRIRMEMEWKTREDFIKRGESGEITLADIWATIENECGIDKDIGMNIEIELEKKYCFANPYMLEVFRYLGQAGHILPRIIATSDMYLPSSVIMEILENNGFSLIIECFVSCEYKTGKGDGSLYKIVTEKLGTNKNYIQIGDNYHSDVIMAGKNNWQAEHYPNVNAIGTNYRAEDMSMITGSIYRGIINSHLHSGLKIYSKEYELGFVYGGLFVLGYCQFIYQHVKEHHIDKILFLSRDGDILHQVFTMLYPDYAEAGKTAYVYWSRLAATKMAAQYFKYDFFRRFLYHKVNQNYLINEIFRSMEIEDMLPDAISFITSSLQPSSENIYLTEKNVEQIKKYLNDNWQTVIAHYDDQLAAGKTYYYDILKGVKKAAAVDVGWAGSGAIALDIIVNKIWKLDCEITGLIAGTNTVHNAEPDISEAQMEKGKLVSYLFSQRYNRDIWKKHDAAKGDNLLVEMLLSSPTGGFIGFLKSKQYNLSLEQKAQSHLHFRDIKEEDKAKALECQKGIKDFVDLYIKTGFKDHNISGSDAYAPIKVLLYNRDYIKDLNNKDFEKVNLE